MSRLFGSSAISIPGQPFALIAFLALRLMVPAQAASNAELVRPEYSPVVPGLDYAHLQTTNWNNGEPWSIHVARLDRSRKDLQLVETLAHGQVFGIAPVSAIAKSFPRERGEPLVVINAGFCIRTRHPYMGAPRGMVIMDRELISGPALSPCNYNLWVDGKGEYHFGKYEPVFRATLPGGVVLPLGLNRQCESNAVVLFTAILGKSTKATNHLELLLEDPQHKVLSWHLGERYRLRVKAVNPAGNTPLSRNIAVLCFGSQTAPQAASLHPGDEIQIQLKTSPELKDIVTAAHATFPVVENGKPLEKFDAQGAILRKNPRTAIGFNQRYLYMVVVDGRQKTLSMGMNAHELAQFMSLLGCTQAINLDGGGSSTFWLKGQTRNSVAGSRERDRSDALVIVKCPPGLARQ